MLGIGCVLVTASAMVIVGVWQGNVFSGQVRLEAEKIINADLNHITESVYNLIKAQDESIQQKVNHDLNVARFVLQGMGEIKLSHETVPWTATNQYTNQQVKINLPKMMVGDQWLGQNELMWNHTAVVDKVKGLVGGTATIFQLMNKQGDMLRVATNVEKGGGKRAIGTFIPSKNPDGKDNPVVSAVMVGETYRGIAYVVNAWYVTAYEPIYNQAEEVIGALYVGVKQENIASLRKAIMDVVIGKTGYVFILGGRGEDQGHYIISKNSRRDGENIWESMDAEGHKFIQSIVKKAVACMPGEFATERYQWKNPDDDAPRWKIVRLAYYEPWDWVIGASVYEDELQDFMNELTAGYKDMVQTFIFVAVIFAIAGGIIAWFFSKPVTHALSVVTRAATKLTKTDLPRLEQTMQSVKDGDLSVDFHFSAESVTVSSKDELGIMAQAFTKMNTALVHIGDSFTSMVARLRDLTEQLESRVKERTAELMESQRRLEDIIDFLPDATLVIDRKGTVITWNRGMESMTNIRATEMIGRRDFEYAVPFYGRRRPMLIDQVLTPMDDFKEKYESFKQEGNVLLAESRIEHLKGKDTFIFETASALFDTKGSVIGAIEIVRDITDRKKIVEKLRHAMIEAEAATRSKSDFLANMSHEIRTPMNAVIGLAGLALKTDLSPKQLDYLKKIETSAQSLLGIINDILDFSKIEAGKLSMETELFNLEDVLKNLSSLIGFKTDEKNIKVVYDIQADIPYHLIGDALRLGQVLTNLTDNAVKFTEQGEILISIKKEDGNDPESDNHVVLCFSIQDTGIGMTPDQVEKLFKSFSQADTSTTRNYGGSGLGLSISKSLVEMMGGRIWVDSEYGKGSTFSFTAGFKLPGNKKIVCAPELKQPTDDGNLIVEELSGIKGSRILLVEDNKINQQVAFELLSHYGFKVMLADNGQGAVDMVKKWFREQEDHPDGRYLPDAILMDIQMPVMDGYTAAKKIRAHEEKLKKSTTPIPIIAMTAHVMSSEHEKYIHAGMNDLVTKPIYPKTLFETLIRWIPVKQNADQPDNIPSQAVAQEIEKFQSLAGFNVQEGLSRVANKEKVYFDMLVALKKEHKAIAEEIKTAINASDMDLAKRLIHIIKGLSGNLSAYRLHDAATALEKAVTRDQKKQINETLTDFSMAFAQVIENIAQLESQMQFNKPLLENNGKCNPEKISRLLTQLAEFIASDYTAAIKTIEKIEHQVQHLFLYQDVIKLKAYIEDFEENRALESIKQIQRKLINMMEMAGTD